GTTLRPLPLVYEFRGRFPLVECGTCHLRFLAVQPTAEGLAELYGAEYFQRDFRCGRSEVTAFDDAAFAHEHQGLVDAFERLVPRGRLLELGCAGGGLLAHARARGWRVTGVELSADAVAEARARGLEVVHGDLMSAAFPARSFDLVYMGDVLEHVPDPRAVLAECARVLAPGGALHLRGPITTHSLARRVALGACALAHRTIVLREPPYHLWEFTPGPLIALFRRCGFERVTLVQSKIAPGRAHGRKSGFERAAMAALDAVNLPLTRAFNVLGDRVVVTARTPAAPAA
ncbi:MAG TPA: class I SAM-dependent methyltransferase, partial [Candidatus Eisenbacteria bacterium]|nr:class I SAM-dependent methyltransferase [Candidatus Eisenbacteria bacterium]